MKFLVPNYSCLQNPWLGGYHPQIPILSVLNWICWTPPPKKSLGTPLFHYNHCATIVQLETGHKHGAIRELRRSCRRLCYQHIMTKQLQGLYQCNIALVRTVVRQLAIGSVEDRLRERHIIISEITPRCEVSGFLRGVVDVFDLLGCSRRTLAVCYRSYGINLSVPFSPPWPIKMGLICCSETSVTNHQPRQRSIPEVRRHQLLLDLIMGMTEYHFLPEVRTPATNFSNLCFWRPLGMRRRGVCGGLIYATGN